MMGADFGDEQEGSMQKIAQNGLSTLQSMLVNLLPLVEGAAE